MTETCREIAELLDDYVTGELSPESSAELERHLDGCASCLAYVESYRKVVALGRELPDEPMPGELVRRLRSLLDTDRSES